MLADPATNIDYLHAELPQTADTIIVGSGISGLSAALVLARQGRRVLVLESHTTPGGCMQRFQRAGSGGPLRFDTGVHYVGSLKPGQVMWRLLRYLGVEIPTIPLRDDGYDRLSFPGGDFLVPVGYEATERALTRACPGEAAIITAWVSRMREIERGLSWHALDPDAEGAYRRDIHEVTTGALLGQLGASARLRALVCGQSSLYGAPASRAPLAIHAAVVGSMTEGPHYMVGGGDTLAGALLARLRELGGSLRLRSAVARVLVDGNRATGIELTDGRRVHAPEVILALHPRAALALMPGDAWRGVLKQRLDAAPDCVGMFCVYGVVESGLEPYAGRNHYLLRDDDPDCFFRPALDGPADAIVNLPPGAPQTFTAMGSAHWDWFAPWQGTPAMRRGPEYAALKQRIAANMLAMITARMPGLKVRVVATASPLTLRDYVGYPQGGLYGLEPGVQAQGRFGVRRRTAYAGLYVAGAGTGTPGILGACVSGFGVAGTILGGDTLLRDVRARTDAYGGCGALLPSAP